MLAKKKLITLMVAGALLPLQANSADVIEYTQDFSGYWEEGHSKKWQLIDPDLYNPLSKTQQSSDPKDFVTEDGTIKFSTNWTYQSLEEFYPNQYRKIISAYEESVKDRKARNQRELDMSKLREKAEDRCPVKMEVGQASVYGLESSQENYVAELDSYACDGKGGNIRLFSYVPTVPGAQYELEVHYQKRGNGSEQDGLLMIKANNAGGQFPLNPVDGEVLEDGFKVKKIRFNADNFYSTIRLKDLSTPDTYGALIGKVSVKQTKANPRVEKCENQQHAEGSESLLDCLLAQPKPELVSCDLGEAVLTFKPGERAITNENSKHYETRGITNNVLWTGSDEKYLTLGKRGLVKLSLQSGDELATCPVDGRVLTINEVTNQPLDYNTWAEKGVLQLKYAGCDVVHQNGWNVYKPNPYSDDQYFKTNAELKVYLDEVFENSNGCSLRAVRIYDRTDKIPETQPGFQEINNGIDINGLTLDYAD